VLCASARASRQRTQPLVGLLEPGLHEGHPLLSLAHGPASSELEREEKTEREVEEVCRFPWVIPPQAFSPSTFLSHLPLSPGDEPGRARERGREGKGGERFGFEAQGGRSDMVDGRPRGIEVPLKDNLPGGDGGVSHVEVRLARVRET
jgi:hypothetical protein